MSKALAKSLLLLIAISVLAVVAPAFAGAAKDPVSGLPLPPGMTPERSHNITICGKQGQGNQYSLPGGTVAANIAWYKTNLPGFHLFHATWSNRSQDTFWSPDGTKGVNITGTPNSDRVFSVMYLQMKTGLTEHERASFSPINPTCK